MESTTPYQATRAPTNMGGSVHALRQDVTLQRDPSVVTSHLHPQLPYEQPPLVGSSRPQMLFQQSAPSHTNFQTQPYRSSDKLHESDHQLVAVRLNEFADFLVRFNNTTVRGMNTHLQRFEATVLERMQRFEAAEQERERRVGERFDSLYRAVQGAVADGMKAAVAEQEKQGREAALLKGVTDAILPVLGARFDDITRHLETNEATTKALQSSVKSLESRLSLLKTQSEHSSATSGTIASSPAPASLRPTSLAPSNSGASGALLQQVEEHGCMLDELARLIEAARDEAHADKEDLSLLFDETHRNLAFTLHDELLALRHAVGVGKGCLKITKDVDVDVSTKSLSLAECFETLAMDLREAMEHVKDAEAAYDGDLSLNLMGVLELLYNDRTVDKESARLLSNAGVMTDDQGPAPECKDVTGMKSDLSPQKPPNEAESIDSPVPTLDTNDLDTLPVDGSVSENTSAATLIDGSFSTDIVVRNQLSISSYQSYYATLFSRAKLDLGAETSKTIESRPSSTALQLFGVHPLPGPSESFISPLSVESSISCPPNVVLKRKADAGDTATEEVEDNIRQKSTDPTRVPAAVSGDTDFMFDLDRPPSPLTPLASEDEEDSSDEDGDTGLSDLKAGEKAASRIVASPSSSPSVPLMDLVREKARMQKQEVAKLLKHWCPNNCGRGYIYKGSLYGHLKRGCARVQKSGQSSIPSSTGSTKRRKLSHETVGSSTSTHSNGTKGRGKLPKAETAAVAFTHPPEVLERCDWPTKSTVDDTFDHQLLQCDRCDSTYHNRCVGVKEGDMRLIPESAFICPPCSYIDDPQSIIKKRGDTCNSCSRPDCDWPGQAANELEDYFVVEKIIGRSVANLKDSGSSERVYLWLIKWLGYPLKDCDWLVKDSLPNADELINQFYAEAAQDELELRNDDSIYLLREARNKLHLAVKKKWKWA